MTTSRTRILIADLIRDLHYCCEFRFFSLYRRTGIIAERLGVTTRAVRARRALYREGKLQCDKCPNCQRKI